MATSTTDIIARLQLRGEQFSSEMGKQFAEVGPAATKAAKELREPFNSAFAEVQRLAANVSKGGLLDLSSEIAQLDQAAQRAETLSTSSRELASAMMLVAAGGKAGSDAMRLEADAAAVASLAHERDAEAIRDRITALQAVQNELQAGARAVGTLGTAQGKAAASSGAMRQAMAGASYQMQDLMVQISMGANPINALVVQGGQLAGQFMNVGGRAGAVASFLMGGWGLAIQMGLMVAAPFVAKLWEGSEAAQAQEKALEEQRKAVLDLAAAQERAIVTSERQQVLDLAKIKISLDAALATRQEAQALLEKARAEAQMNNSVGAVAVGGEAIGEAQRRSRNRVTELEQQLAANAAELRKLEQGFGAGFARMVGGRVDALRDPKSGIDLIYRQQRAALEGDPELQRNGRLLAAKIAALTDARDRELKAVEASTATIRRSSEALTSAQVAKALRGEFAGINITSTDRSYEKQAALYARYKSGAGPLAAPPGSSFHEKGQAVDIAKSAGITRDGLQQFFELRNIQAKIIDEGRHFHVQWANGKNALAEFNDERQRQKKVAEEVARAERELAADLDRVIAVLDPARVAAEGYAAALATIDKAVGAGKLSDGEAFDLRMRAMRAETERKSADFNQTAVTILGTGMSDAVQEWERGLTAGAVAGSETLIGGVRGAVNELRFGVSGIADLLGVRVSGPASRLLQSRGIEGQTGEITDALERTFKGIGINISDKSLASINSALAGAAYGQIGGSIFSGITGQKDNKTASAIGGVLGDVGGKAIGKTLATAIPGALGKTLGSAAGPIGAIAGGILGNLIGGLFRTPKFGEATVTGMGKASLTGNKGSLREAAGTAAGSVQEGLAQIAKQLGGTVGAFDLMIGQYEGKWRVRDSSSGWNGKGGLNFKGASSNGLNDFGENGADQAIAYAISNALLDGAIEGISAASKRILAKATDQGLETALEKALMIEAIPRQLKEFLDPVGAAIDDLNRKWQKTIDALKEGGASAEQMAQAEQLYRLELDRTKQSTQSASASLRDFITDLKLGSASPLSLRDQQDAAMAQLQPFLTAIEAGQTIDQSKYQSAAQSLLDVEREMYGSTSRFFETFDRIQAATNKAIADIDNAQPVTPAVPDPFTKETAAKIQTGNEIAAQTSDMMAQAVALLQQLAANNGGGGSGGFIGGTRNFMRAV